MSKEYAEMLCINCTHDESEHMETADRICQHFCDCRGFDSGLSKPKPVMKDQNTPTNTLEENASEIVYALYCCSGGCDGWVHQKDRAKAITNITELVSEAVNKAVLIELKKLYITRWLVPLELGTSKMVVTANDIKARIIELETPNQVEEVV